MKELSPEIASGYNGYLAAKRPGKPFFRYLAKYRALFVMLLPAIFFFIIFHYIPMVGVVLAFKKFNFDGGIFFSPWNGFENFRFFFVSGKAFMVARNTVLYNLIFIGAGTLFAMAVAIFLSEIKVKVFRRTAQSVILLPHFLSWVVVSVFVYNLFSYRFGGINSFLKYLELQPVDFYSRTWYWYILLPIFYLWKTVGYSSVLYLAAIMGISSEYYEAAIVDGANIFQRIRFITLPLLKPTMVTLVLIALSHVFKGQFDMFYQIIGNNGNLYDGTDIIDTFVFRSIIEMQDIGMSSAASVLQSAMNFIFIVLVNEMIKKIQPEYALY